MNTCDKSALGDLSGIKGTHYHLLYALYLLVRERVPQLWFYRGSDLLAQPASPPPEGASEATIGVDRDDRQVWVQLKNTDQRWTPTAVIRDVLPNLGIAALSSEDEGRAWRAMLVTPGEIATKSLREFIDHPTDFPRINCWFEEAVGGIATSRDNPPSAADTDRVRAICMDVLTQIVRCSRLSIGEVREALLRELTDQHGSSARAEAMLRQLLGQLLEDAGKGTGGPYDQDWLDQTAGVDVLPKGAFDISVRQACNDQVDQALRLLPEWDPEVCISRDEFVEAIDRFTASSDRVFVLVGSTDAGKSWALADYAHRHLPNQVRCIRTGDDLLEAGSLAELVGAAFSPLTKSDRDNGDICDAWRGEALAHQQPPVLIVDEIASPGDDERLQRKLQRLAVDAAALEIKLIIGINEAVFHGNQPVAKIDDRAIYSPAGSKSRASHRLSGLTKVELRRLAKRVVPSAEVSRVVAEAETIDPHANESVRIATYLLRRLSEGHSEAAAQKADELLAEMLQQRLSRIASGITPLSEEEVHLLVREALAEAWRVGREGVTRRELINVAEEYGAASPATLVPQLQRHGLLTTTTPFRPAGNSLTGLLIAEAIQDAEDLEWVQSLDLGASVEPLFFWALAGDKFSSDTARAIRLRHRQVGEPICRGLAQRSDVTQDHFLLLLQWGRGGGRVVAFPPACEAIGRIVDLCPAARDWVETAYISPKSWERARAEIALSAALSVDPDWAVEQVRHRLSEHVVDAQPKRDRKRWMRHALRPLEYAPPTVARESVEQLLADVQRWADEVPDTFIGLTARWGGYEDVSALGRLKRELRSNNRMERLTAAEAAFVFSEHNPEAAVEILSEAIASERDDYVLTRLVRALFHLTSRPEEVVHCLMGTSATDPAEFAGATGISCAILARIADTHAREVATLLPESLDNVHPTYAAQLWEGLAYAWWRVAEQLPGHSDKLERLTQPNLCGTFDEGTHCDRGLTVFAHRGMAVACLGMAALTDSECQTGESVEAFFYRMDLSPGLSAQLTPYLREHASRLWATDSMDDVLTAYTRTLRLYQPSIIHPVRDWANMQFGCLQHSAEDVAMLLLPHLGDTDLLEPILEDWQRLRAAKVIFTETNESEVARELLRRECDRVAGQASLQGGEERSEGLAMLAAHTDDPVGFYLDERAASPLEGPRHNARIVGKLMDSHPERTVQLLHELLREPTDLAALYEWCHEPTRFQPYVLSDVVHRSFDPAPLSKDDALDLCRRSVDAVGACSGRGAQEWRHIYSALLASLADGEVETRMPQGADTLWGTSHRLAFVLITQGRQSEDLLVEWLGSHAGAHLVDPRHLYKDSSGVSFGFGISANHLAFVFPAVRIALVACSSAGDPTAIWFERREQVRQALDRWKSATDPMLNLSSDRVQMAVTEFKTLIPSSWWDLRLLERLSVAYLSLEALAEALWALRHADRIHGLLAADLGRVHYNRACAHAKLRQYEQAAHNLNRAVELGWRQADWAKEDPDFIAVRDMPWFKSAVGRAGKQRQRVARTNPGPDIGGKGRSRSVVRASGRRRHVNRRKSTTSNERIE